MTTVVEVLLEFEIANDPPGWTERVRVSVPSTKLSSITDTLKSNVLALDENGGTFIVCIVLTKSTSIDSEK